MVGDQDLAVFLVKYARLWHDSHLAGVRDVEGIYRFADILHVEWQGWEKEAGHFYIYHDIITADLTRNFPEFVFLLLH